MFYHIFQYLQADFTVPLWAGKCSAVIQTHNQTHKHTHHLPGYQKSPACVSVTPGFCFLHGLQWQWGFPFSVTHVERWYVWMMNRTPQRIPNWEHVMVVRVGRSFIFILGATGKLQWSSQRVVSTAVLNISRLVIIFVQLHWWLALVVCYIGEYVEH